MTPRRTSIDTYRAIANEGLLSRRRLQVYSVLFEVGPATAAEISNATPGLKSASKGDNVHARLLELKELGCVYERGERKCRMTGRRAITWDVTESLPVKKQADRLEKLRLKRRNLMRSLNQVENEIRRLEQSEATKGQTSLPLFDEPAGKVTKLG